MRKAFQKIASVTAAFLMTVVYALPAQAALMNNGKVTLSEPKAGAGSSYTFEMNVGQAGGSIKGIKMAWRTDASASAQQPTSVALASATLNTVETAGSQLTSAAGWAIDKTDAASGVLYVKSATGNNPGSKGKIAWMLDSITNPSIAAPPTGCTPSDVNGSTGTCFLRVTTFSTDTLTDMQNGTNVVDEVTVTFTVTNDVTVTAKVDPSLTFTVDGVASGQATNGQTTSATSTYNTLPFGYLQTNTPKYLAHDLKVKTNANNGYVVTVKMKTAMTGTYAGNKIDPFAGNASTWGAPQNWTTPTGNVANTNTGWVGANTTDTDVTGWAAATGKWGPVNSTENQVMRSTTPDLGNVATRVSFAVEVNVYQPSDSYTGTLIYNCIPTY